MMNLANTQETETFELQSNLSNINLQTSFSSLIFTPEYPEDPYPWEDPYFWEDPYSQEDFWEDDGVGEHGECEPVEGGGCQFPDGTFIGWEDEPAPPVCIEDPITGLFCS
ncbi:MAG: hypothetical protein MRY59_11930 [Aquisalinus sp.]|nr:hypothetical protein [Aquisalinus sp.]